MPKRKRKAGGSGPSLAKLRRLLAKAEAATFLYFAFGSNLDPKQIKARCPHAQLLGPAKLHGHMLAFGGFSQRWRGSVATVVPTKGSAVQGLLFRLSVRCIQNLDRFEGHPFAYKREPVIVRDALGHQHKAFTYIQPLDTFESWPPSAEYFTQILEAYVANDFDLAPLVHAATPRLFVYGSLMAGLSNHGRLQGARFIGRATAAGFSMHSLGGFPGVVREGEGSVHGEVYEVDGAMLTDIDRLEGHPRFYRRTLIRLTDGSSAETYLLQPHHVSGTKLVASGDWRKHKDSK